MTRMRYDPTVTLGHILQAAVLMLGLIAGYVKLNVTLGRHDLQLSATVETVKTLSKTQAEITENLKVLTAIVDERTSPVRR